jgi:hypothetical protein
MGAALRWFCYFNNLENHMTKHTLTLVALLTTAVSVSACMQDSALNAPPGTYEKTTKSTDANGTTTKTDKSTEVYYDEYGNKKAVVKSKTTKDPKGLFNKTTTESEEMIEQ